MPIRLLRFTTADALPITEFSSHLASSVPLAHGSGETHAYVVHIAPGGLIGPHPAGLDQLFLVIRGSGWVAGADGERLTIDTDSGAFIPTGELHSKGSESGLIAVMVQATHFSS